MNELSLNQIEANITTMELNNISKNSLNKLTNYKIIIGKKFSNRKDLLSRIKLLQNQINGQEISINTIITNNPNLIKLFPSEFLSKTNEKLIGYIKTLLTDKDFISKLRLDVSIEVKEQQQYLDNLRRQAVYAKLSKIIRESNTSNNKSSLHNQNKINIQREINNKEKSIKDIESRYKLFGIKYLKYSNSNKNEINKLSENITKLKKRLNLSNINFINQSINELLEEINKFLSNRIMNRSLNNRITNKKQNKRNNLIENVSNESTPLIEKKTNTTINPRKTLSNLIHSNELAKKSPFYGIRRIAKKTPLNT